MSTAPSRSVAPSKRHSERWVLFFYSDGDGDRDGGCGDRDRDRDRDRDGDGGCGDRDRDRSSRSSQRSASYEESPFL